MRASGNTADDERRIAAAVSDLIRLCERRYAPCYSDFLSENEALMAQRALQTSGCTQYIMWGGYEEAQRVMLCVYPEFCEPEKTEFPLETLSLSFRKSAKLTHRDFLGSLMGTGIRREAIGDIVIAEGAATFFVKSELAPYIRAQIDKVGREGVEFTENGVDLSSIKQSFEESARTVTSPRVDAIVGECTGLSRAKAQQLVRSGLVCVNARQIVDTDHRIEDSDKLSVRGYGKFIIRFDGSLSKKGKYRITVLKYL